MSSYSAAESPIGEYTSAVRLGIGQIIAAASLAGVLCSCGPSPQPWVGSWTGKLAITAQPGQDQTILNSFGKVTLEIRPDLTFTLITETIPKDGRVEIEGSRAKLIVEQVANRPVESQGADAQRLYDEMNLSLQPDGSLVFTDGDLLQPRNGRQSPVEVRLSRK